MKNHIYLIITLVLFCSCNDSKKQNEKLEQSTKTVLLNQEEEKLGLEILSDSTLNEWLHYHKKQKPSFSLTNFYVTTKDTLKLVKGNVFGNFDKEFDKTYEKFLVYNSLKTLYLDFDSYGWTINENGELSSSPDQEINLVDIKNKTVNRIAFRGPSQWVEDVFWKNDSTIILLEKKYEKQPIITEINLQNNLIRSFKYNDTVAVKTKYIDLRFIKKGIHKK